MSNTHESQSVGEQSEMGMIFAISSAVLVLDFSVSKLSVLNLSRNPILCVVDRSEG